jgi:hypothetical protein
VQVETFTKHPKIVGHQEILNEDVERSTPMLQIVIIKTVRIIINKNSINSFWWWKNLQNVLDWLWFQEMKLLRTKSTKVYCWWWMRRRDVYEFGHACSVETEMNKRWPGRGWVHRVIWDNQFPEFA